MRIQSIYTELDHTNCVCNQREDYSYAALDDLVTGGAGAVELMTFRASNGCKAVKLLSVLVYESRIIISHSNTV